MIIVTATIAGTLLIGGCASLYLTSAHQRLLPKPLSPRTPRVLGGTGLAAALAILLSIMGPATAVFTWMVGLMAACTILPVVIGWLSYRRETNS